MQPDARYLQIQIRGWFLHSISSSPAQPARVDLSPTLLVTLVRAACPYPLRNTPVFRQPWVTVAVPSFRFPFLAFSLSHCRQTPHGLIMSPNAAHWETTRLAAETPVVPAFSVFSEPSPLLAVSRVPPPPPQPRCTQLAGFSLPPQQSPSESLLSLLVTYTA